MAPNCDLFFDLNIGQYLGKIKGKYLAVRLIDKLQSQTGQPDSVPRGTLVKSASI